MVNVSLKRACLVGHPIKHALLRLLKLSITHCNDRYCQLQIVFLYQQRSLAYSVRAGRIRLPQYWK